MDGPPQNSDQTFVLNVVTGGHDHQLIEWAHRTGRWKPTVGLHDVEVRHDDTCPRLSGHKPCTCTPIIQFGMDILEWADSPMGRS